MKPILKAGSQILVMVTLVLSLFSASAFADMGNGTQNSAPVMGGGTTPFPILKPITRYAAMVIILQFIMAVPTFLSIKLIRKCLKQTQKNMHLNLAATVLMVSRKGKSFTQTPLPGLLSIGSCI